MHILNNGMRFLNFPDEDLDKLMVPNSQNHLDESSMLKWEYWENDLYICFLNIIINHIKK